MVILKFLPGKINMYELIITVFLKVVGWIIDYSSASIEEKKTFAAFLKAREARKNESVSANLEEKQAFDEIKKEKGSV